MQKIQVFAGQSVSDSDTRTASVVDYSDDGVQEMLRVLGLEYKMADYFQTRRVVIVIDPDTADPHEGEIFRLRQALIASGVKEGLVDAIQEGNS